MRRRINQGLPPCCHVHRLKKRPRGQAAGGDDMHRFLIRNHAPVLSVSKELKTWVAVISLALLATAAWADPQSEISAYRKSYSLPAVTADAKLTELARQQANAMAERRSMDHNDMHPFTLA
jgi:hypothetical protein